MKLIGQIYIQSNLYLAQTCLKQPLSFPPLIFHANEPVLSKHLHNMASGHYNLSQFEKPVSLI